MRLLHTKRLEFAEFRDKDQRPKYVIASHRWVEGDEVTLQDVQNRRNIDKSGYKKIEALARYVRNQVRTVEWLWIDTCCIARCCDAPNIDPQLCWGSYKTSVAELSEAVNSMFEWYRGAELCIAYLADVKSPEDMSSFKESEWFKRGWTLQELLAPQLVVFVTQGWQVIGSKRDLGYNKTVPLASIGVGCEKDIAGITGIPVEVIYNFNTSLSLSVEERLKWMEGRTTTREEDMSYALYGIFNVAPGAHYGEQHGRARQRLLTAINYEDTLATQRAEYFCKIADWLSPADPWTNHSLARSLHEPQTGTWLVQSDQYRRWISAATRHLWIHGKAGCGKTILCSTAIEDVKEHCQHHPDAGYAVFYFSFSDDRKQRLVDLLLSLVVQLGWKGPALSMLQMYENPNGNLPDLEELEKILISCFEAYDEVFLLIDALDECPEHGDVRHSILECLTRLLRKGQHVKMFATSRELPDIHTSMAALGSEAIPLGTATRLVDADIRQYVANELTREHRLSRLDPKTKTLIEETLSAKADGVFRWAYCQVQELKKLKSTRPSVVVKALTTLPATLDETYERMLLQLDHETCIDALKLLRWLAYAKSPPSLSELVEAAVIDLQADGAVEIEDRPGLEDTLHILSDLIAIVRDPGDSNKIMISKGEKRKWQQFEDDEFAHTSRNQQIYKDTKIKLVHFSVKEYLKSKRIRDGIVKEFYLESSREHKVLAQSCLVYLMHYSKSKEKTSTSQDLTTFPLLQYAAESWFYHSALQEPGTVTREVALLSAETMLCDWLRVHRPDKPWELPFHDLTNVGSNLYYASFLGLQYVVDELLKSGAEVNAQGGMYNNALQAASGRGYEKVVQMLLDAGAEVNAQGGGRHSNALQAASARGYEKVVRILMDAGAEVNAQVGGCTALYAASERGYEKVVQILLDAGAEANASGWYYGNALQAASQGGHEKVVQMLLDAGAEVNHQEWRPSNALQVPSPPGKYDNALQAAAYKGHTKVVQILLDAGAEANARGGKYGNALQAASEGGHEKVVQMLLDAGADVDARGGMYCNALYAAADRGHEKVVQVLLDAGADVNAQGGRHINALQAAANRGNKKVVQMLLDAGAEVNAQSENYGNALYAATNRGHKKVVQMLIHAGAEVNTQGVRYSNALPGVRQHKTLPGIRMRPPLPE